MRKLKLILGGVLIMALSLVVPQSPFSAVADAQTYPPEVRCALSLSASVVPQGATISVSANCFLPGSTVQVVLRSHPEVLRTFTANARGVISGPVTIPCDAHLGAHTISAEGVDAAGKPLTLRSGIRIVDGCPAGVATAQPSRGALSKTGSDMTVPLTAAGLVLMAAGTAAVITARRRRAAQSS